ncbi:hypothetical protein Golob_018540, partial [Gossypium lobatum]|nr:hypothetical protein [Gossypium lobatum]
MQNEEGQNMDLYIPRKCLHVIFICCVVDVVAARPLTGSSPQRITHPCRSMSVIWMSLADTLAHSPPLL